VLSNLSDSASPSVIFFLKCINALANFWTKSLVPLYLEVMEIENLFAF
jgi:hypothetical protein